MNTLEELTHAASLRASVKDGLREVRAVVKTGEWSKSKEMCECCIRADRDNADAWYLYGITIFKLQGDQYDTNVLECFRRAVKNNAKVVSYRVALANALMMYQACEAYMEALRHYDIALNLNAHSGPALYGSAIALCGLGRFDDAHDAMQRAVALGCSYADAQDLVPYFRDQKREGVSHSPPLTSCS